MGTIYLTPYRRKHVLIHFHESTAPGSVFHASVFPTPESLLSYLNEHEPITITADFADREVWLYRATEFPSVGTLGLLARSEVEANVIVHQARGRYTHEVAEVDVLPVTNFIYVVVKRTKDGLELITAFPGDKAAPFPSKKQNPHDRKRCIAFWKEHVLLVAKR